MTPRDIDKLIQRYLAGECSKEECDLVDSWYASMNERNQSSANQSDHHFDATGARILEKIHLRTGRQPSRTRSWYYTGIAAAVCICLASGYFLLTSNRDHSPPSTAQANAPEFSEIRNTDGHTKRAILPDGSIVILSPDSRIKYRNGVDTGTRELFLEGEAYFDVAHDSKRPFFVYAGDVITRVLGTSFKIRHRGHNEKTTVSVKTGKVTVYSRKAAYKKTVLTPNQEAVYDRSTDMMATQAVPEERIIEEKKAFTEMHFEETPVPEVLAVLMKTYDIDIAFQEELLSNCVLTSSFFEEGLYDRIDVICTAIGASYKIVEAKIVIESNGCNLKPN